jgi:quercetin dioxygenase-like cupin family protein
MPSTIIHTSQLPRHNAPQGEVCEIINRELAGANNVVGMLRWLKSGEKFEAAPEGWHQLLYVMEGQGTLRLDGGAHEISRGSGAYLGPSEAATVEAGSGSPLKLLHLIVPQISS